MNPPEQQSPVPASDAEHTGQRHPSATVSLLPPQQQTPRLDWTNKLLANRGAGPNARLRVRPRLTVAFWAGDVDAAAQVADKLVDNAVKHGMPFSDGCVSIRLRVAADTDDLEIRRARAVGILADPQHALDLMSGRDSAAPTATPATTILPSGCSATPSAVLAPPPAGRVA